MTCVIALFARQPILNGWRIGGATFEGTPFQYKKKPWVASEEPASADSDKKNETPIVVEVVVQPGDVATLSLTNLSLVGPDCKQWRKAFGN
jgi:hypothetical protein